MEPDREKEMPDIPSSIPFFPHVVTLLCNLAHDSITIEVFGLSSFFNYLLVVGFPFAVTQAIYGTTTYSYFILVQLLFSLYIIFSMILSYFLVILQLTHAPRGDLNPIVFLNILFSSI